MKGSEASATRLRLRRQAEEALRSGARKPRHTAGDAEVLLQELQTHQVELEMQNESLQHAQHDLLHAQEILQERARELEEERHRYQLLFELAPEAYVTTDPKGDIQEVNRAACRLVGKGRARLVGARLPLLFAEEDQPAVQAVLADAGRNGLPPGKCIEGKLRQEDRWLDCEISVNEVRRSDGVLAGLHWILHDVAQRRRTQALRESEERFRTLVESQAQAVWEADAQGQQVAGSASWRAYTGQTFDETQGSGWADAVHPEDREFAQRSWREAVATGRNFEAEFRLRQAPGGYRWTHVRAAPIRAEDGSVLKWVGMNMDIDDRKQAEAEARASEERLRLALDASSGGTWSWDSERNDSTWDDQFHRHYGFGADTPRGLQSWLDRLHPEDRARVTARIEQMQQTPGDDLWSMEFRVLHLTLGERWRQGIGRATRDASGKLLRMAGIDLDVTARKKAEAVLARDKAELERLVNERTAKLQEAMADLEHFSYTITHDLKAPLRAMKGFAEMATGLCDRQDVKELLHRIEGSSARMEHLITDALSYSRAARQELPLTAVDTGPLLRGMLEIYPELQADRADIHLEGELPVVLGNEAALTQCFSNLLTNAVKFVAPGCKPNIRVWAEPVGDRPAGAGAPEWVRIWVADQGIGIGEGMLPRVFDMFSKGSKEYEGTGIGLALVRKVTQRMGGRVGVESEEGKGSRFWLELRYGQQRPKVTRAAAPPARSPGGTVLYVEDEESDAIFMRRAFAKLGREDSLRIVSDGRVALEYLSGAEGYGDRGKHPFPALVLLDLNLPAVSGFEVLRWIRAQPQLGTLPVVVFSSSTREDDRTRSLQMGANEFLPKPNTGSKFTEVVKVLQEQWHV